MWARRLLLLLSDKYLSKTSPRNGHCISNEFQTEKQKQMRKKIIQYAGCFEGVLQK
jgi:hypothetical protein